MLNAKLTICSLSNFYAMQICLHILTKTQLIYSIILSNTFTSFLQVCISTFEKRNIYPTIDVAAKQYPHFRIVFIWSFGKWCNAV